MLLLNERAAKLCETMVADAQRLRIDVVRCAGSGARILNCGIRGAGGAAVGGLSAGGAMAEVCLGGLGNVHFTPSSEFAGTQTCVTVQTDHPVAACMASQYAGWQISVEKYFAMGSGPMRAAAKKEILFDDIGMTESPESAVGVLESGKIPTADVCEKIAGDCGISPERLWLLIAPTASIAGGVQVVARSVETALHKLHEIGFPLDVVHSAFGFAPLPPVARHDLAAIGRTNDAVLYGGRVQLWVSCEDEQIASLGPAVPSSASSDFGRPFAEVFAGCDHDFYKIDPHLFSPAEVTFNNAQSGRAFTFGQVRPEILEQSFGG